jgi:hypothetical protein
MTALARPYSNCKRQTRPLAREGAPYQQARNCLTNKNLVLDSRWVFDTRETGRLTVGRNITSTLTLNRRQKCYSYSKTVLQLIVVPPGEYPINRFI